MLYVFIAFNCIIVVVVLVLLFRIFRSRRELVQLQLLVKQSSAIRRQDHMGMNLVEIYGLKPGGGYVDSSTEELRNVKTIQGCFHGDHGWSGPISRQNAIGDGSEVSAINGDGVGSGF